MAVTASLPSRPGGLPVTTWPLVARMPITLSRLLASAVLASADSRIDDSNLAAAIASEPAGRACKSPASVTAASEIPVALELPGMTSLLCRARDGLDVTAHGGGDGRGHRTLDERRVGDGERLRQADLLRQQSAHSQDRSAKIRKDDHARAGGCRCEGAPDLVYARAEAAVVGAASRHDGHPAPANLVGQLGGPCRQARAVRDEDDPHPRDLGHGLS